MNAKDRPKQRASAYAKAQRASLLVFTRAERTSRGMRFFYDVDGKTYTHFHSFDWKSVTLEPEVAEVVCTHVGLSFVMDLSLTCLPKEIRIEAIALPAKALAFWKKVYESMAMERLYAERLPVGFLSAKWSSGGNDARKLRKFRTASTGRVILAMSGGKESLTALKIFERMKIKPCLFYLRYPESAIEPALHWRKKVHAVLSRRFPSIVHRSDITNTVPIRRRFACKHADGFDMGEIIFGSLLYADQYDHIVMGNELSANFGNCIYEGRGVNHQYVKTLELAKDINRYIRTYLHPTFTYFSPFFGYYEYPIGQMFCSDARYFDIWNSCNMASPKAKFCCTCPKCAFTYLLVLAFTSKKLLAKYFWKDMTQDLALTKPLFQYGKSEKPLECVGEKKEVWCALEQIYKRGADTDSPTMRYFLEEVYPKVRAKLPAIRRELMKEHSDFRNVPRALRAPLRKACARILSSSPN